jgi:hypothetical protein
MRQAGRASACAGLVCVFAGILPSDSIATSDRLAAPLEPREKTAPNEDPMFSQPYIDLDEWRDKPVRHRYVHGGFKDTDTRFSFYLPPKERYDGRFFQHITPVPDSENLAQAPTTPEEDKIAFSIDSGAYYIETNGGGAAQTGRPGTNVDPTIAAYRANAASAEYSRTVAVEMYGEHRPFGYAYGGSGGGYRTIGAIENTNGVYDGVVPYVIGSSMSIPNMFTVRMHAMRVLADKFDQIVDAMEPGGSGDMYAGLSEDESDALREVTRMGFQPLAWFGHRTMGIHAFSVLYGGMVMADPQYFEDFWTKPGYLGYDRPDALAKARLQFRTTVTARVDAERTDRTGRGAADSAWQVLLGEGADGPVVYQLADSPPDSGFMGGDLIVLSGEAVGERVYVRKIVDDRVVLGEADAGVVARIKPGDEVQVDNSSFLAAQTYHRHQVPGSDFAVWDQFRDEDGNPIHPQRPMLLGPLFATAATGSLQTGDFEGKMIVLEALWDCEALPWQADWYRSKVREHRGDDTDANFQLWYIDRALHAGGARQEDPTRTVSYVGALQQALRDLSRWVEQGIDPPAPTQYRMDDGQVVVPATAAERRGIQPVVLLEVNGGARADVAVGEQVAFTGTIEVPPGAGSVVVAEWDFEGTGDFPLASELQGNPGERQKVTVQTRYGFSKPGTYFPTLRGISQRDGDAATPFGRVHNLGRVRVVVK